jgi:serine/threonine-protein kinase
MRLVSRLDHPSIVRALDAGELRGAPFIVMEYVPGITLDRVMERQGPLSPAEVVRYAYEAALGLAHIHERGIIHRDIKPSNLILGEDGRVRILDLGLGALTEVDESEGSFATADGLAVGTVEYMSPEQAAGRPLTGLSDLFSLGCTLYHLLTGTIPFTGDSKIERLARRLTEKARPISTLCYGVPHALVEIVERLMMAQPADRYSDVKELVAALQMAGATPALPLSGSTNAGPGADTKSTVPTTNVAQDLPPPTDRCETSRSSENLPSEGQLGWWFRVLFQLAEWPVLTVLLVIFVILGIVFTTGVIVGHALL